MESTPPRKRSFGCFYIIAAVIAVLVVYEWINDENDVARVYVAPINSQEMIAQYAATKLNELQPKSFEKGTEFCGMIYEDKEGNLSSTEIFMGDGATCDFEFEWGGEFNPVASFHTHGSHDFEFDNEVPSPVDMEQDIKNQVDGYIATPGGRLWRIDWREEYAEQVCGEGCMRKDPKFQRCDAYPVKPKYTMKSLEERIENDPERC